MAEIGSLVMGSPIEQDIVGGPARPPRTWQQTTDATPSLLPQQAAIIGAAVIPAAGLPAYRQTLAATGDASSEPYLIGQLRAAGDAGLLLAAAFHRLGGSGPAPEQKYSGGHENRADNLIYHACQGGLSFTLAVQQPAELFLRLARHLGAGRVGRRELVAPGPRPAGVDDSDGMRHVALGPLFRRQPRVGRRIP